MPGPAWAPPPRRRGWGWRSCSSATWRGRTTAPTTASPAPDTAPRAPSSSSTWLASRKASRFTSRLCSRHVSDVEHVESTCFSFLFWKCLLVFCKKNRLLGAFLDYYKLNTKNSQTQLTCLLFLSLIPKPKPHFCATFLWNLRTLTLANVNRKHFKCIGIRSRFLIIISCFIFPRGLSKLR